MQIRQIRRILKNEYKQTGNWRLVAKEFGISKAMAWRIANTDYDPKDAHIRARLGLPAMRPAPVCPRCGRVHVRRSCPDAPRHYRDFLSMPKTLIVQMFENREEIK